MPDLKYRYVLEFYGDDASALGRTPVTVDWLPAVEYAHFAGIRAGALPPVTVAPPNSIEPIWDTSLGPPHVAGARVALDTDGGAPFTAAVPLTYFNAAARDASAEYVKDGRLKAGQTFRYRVTAFPAHTPADETPAPGGGFEVEAVPRPLVFHDTPVAPLLDGALLVGHDDPEDIPVFVPHRLLEEARRLVREAGPMETGGVLLGRLHRDTARRDVLFVELTAQLPARHTRSHATKLTFTPETWAAARDALALRNAGEAIQGWWHSHPNWCLNCDPDRQKVCPLRGVFFSSDDVAVQRAVFPRAYHLGLLLSDRPAGIIPALFGWRRGSVEARSFHLLHAPVPPPARELAVTPSIGGEEHAHD
jgi:proteasome lid subunit RPN8/RPN11